MANETPKIDPADFIGPLQPAPPITISIPLRWVKVTHHSPDHIAQRYCYAAFGSNLSIAQMAQRCPMADPVGAGLLRSARLVFAYYLGIVEDANATTAVGVYRLNAADVANLDRYEGLGRSYERFLVTIELNGEAVRCFTYVKRDNAPEAPNERYYATCLQGYTDWNLDARRLRHARDFARKNQKVKRYQPVKWGAGFDFDEWYQASIGRPGEKPVIGKPGNDEPTGDYDAVPEDDNAKPYTSLVTGRERFHRNRTANHGRGTVSVRRYDEMRPDEIKAAISRCPVDGTPCKPTCSAWGVCKRSVIPYAPPSDDPTRTSALNGNGQTTFTNAKGERWVKGANNVWRRAKED